MILSILSGLPACSTNSGTLPALTPHGPGAQLISHSLPHDAQLSSAAPITAHSQDGPPGTAGAIHAKSSIVKGVHVVGAVQTYWFPHPTLTRTSTSIIVRDFSAVFAYRSSGVGVVDSKSGAVIGIDTIDQEPNAALAKRVDMAPSAMNADPTCPDCALAVIHDTSVVIPTSSMPSVSVNPCLELGQDGEDCGDCDSIVCSIYVSADPTGSIDGGAVSSDNDNEAVCALGLVTSFRFCAGYPTINSTAVGTASTWEYARTLCVNSFTYAVPASSAYTALITGAFEDSIVISITCVRNHYSPTITQESAQYYDANGNTENFPTQSIPPNVSTRTLTTTGAYTEASVINSEIEVNYYDSTGHRPTSNSFDFAEEPDPGFPTGPVGTPPTKGPQPI